MEQAKINMKIFFILALILIALTACNKTQSAENRSNDSIRVADSVQSRAVEEKNKTGEGDYSNLGYSVYAKPVDASEIDTTTTLVITTNCIIWVNETASDAAARAEEEERQYAKDKEAALQYWNSQSHDSTEIFEYNPEFNDDVYYYQGMASSTFYELNIPVISVGEGKHFVLLKNENGKAQLINVRIACTPDWEIILFHVEKEPRKLDLMSVHKEALQNYFFH